jgi:hypothetical protein
MLLAYIESRLKSSFYKFYGCYNDLVCDYKLSLAHMLNDLFHTICQTVISTLALTTGNPVHLISTKGVRRVWPVSRGCLLLPGIWSYLRIFRRSMLPYTRFVIAFWVIITFYTLLTSLVCIVMFCFVFCFVFWLGFFFCIKMYPTNAMKKMYINSRCCNDFILIFI